MGSDVGAFVILHPLGPAPLGCCGRPPSHVLISVNTDNDSVPPEPLPVLLLPSGPLVMRIMESQCVMFGWPNIFHAVHEQYFLAPHVAVWW